MTYDFDARASSWDEDPKRVHRAEMVAHEMRQHMNLASYNRSLEYGSGTGLLSFFLKDDLKDITMMDASSEMTKVAKEKFGRLGIKNVRSLQGDLLEDGALPFKYDLVFSLMTLHHVEDVPALISVFHQVQTSGATLALIDLEEEDGSFHDYEFSGHRGFSRKEITGFLQKGGYEIRYLDTCYIIKKEKGTESKEYPLFLAVATRDE